MNVMQQPAPYLPYGTMPGIHAQRVGFFGLHLYLAGRCCKNPLSARSLAQSKPSPGTTCLVSVTIFRAIFR